MNSDPQPGVVARAQPIRVLLVDDHVVTRIGLRTLLSGFSQIEVAGEAGSVASALTEAMRLKPDIILLDVRLSDGNGFDACRQLQKLGSEARVLILTSFADDETIFESIAAGADGYLLKEIDGDGLLRAITNVAEGKSILDPAITRRVLSRLRMPGPEPKLNSKLNLLSAQERRVLALVAEGKTNKEIAVELSLSDKTVKNYLSNTLDKLKVSRRSEAAAVYVRGSPFRTP
jgi:two-component system, NarL family, response regulator DevR